MTTKRKDKSALSVSGGVNSPGQVNEDAVSSFKNKRKQKLDAKSYVEGIVSGNRVLLSKAITLIESSLDSHSNLATEIVSQCLPHSGKSLRIGITGIPGVGKSTFIESFGTYITSQKKKLAVLAIDPTSERSRGSILGDKTRMEKLGSDKNAFIRPSPSGGSLGGVSRKTRESIILCEAAGFDVLFIETVGVGQSETAVHSMVDFFLLLMLAGAGDELQGIKRGIMEMADAIAINKADGDNIKKAEMARIEYENALHLFPVSDSGWKPLALTCSALTGNGISGIWDLVQKYEKQTRSNGFFEKRRNRQSLFWMYESINSELKSDFFKKIPPGVFKEYENRILTNQLDPFSAAGDLVRRYFNEK